MALTKLREVNKEKPYVLLYLYYTHLPVQLIKFPLHFPVCRHVLVTFPSTLPYPLWQPNTQFDPNVLPQDTVNRMAFGGMLKGAQETALKRENRLSRLKNVLKTNQLHKN